MSEDQAQIREELLSIEDWKVYEKAKSEGTRLFEVLTVLR
jgi:hypothetical protein